ncbi:MAG: alkaline phosphatase family protein [Actinomycetota bacterium]|nr:alkaline phosphatase family protein [Actinomycetota bacterium]
MTLTRRQLLGSAAGVGVAAALGPGGLAALAGERGQRAVRYAPLPAPAASGLDHIVMVCMENRSFDHYLGWLPGADGRQGGLTYRDDHGIPHRTHHLSDRNGCGNNDPDHSYEGGRLQFNRGRLDGFRKGGNDDFALGYYTAEDLPLYAPLVREATAFDRYFCSILGPTYPNRFYTHAAATDRLENTSTTSVLPTIWDRLASAGVPARYYFSDVPFLALWGQKYLPVSSPIERFYAEAASGTLPSFSYLDPFFLGEGQGGSNDDHPHADIHRGQSFLSLVIKALTSSPQWSKTALVITYDEWGGFFDHVRPPRLPDDHDTGPRGKDDHAQAGFRVPTFLLSPFARRNHVAHQVYDHTSILKMVEWRFGLAPLTRRDRAARNLAESMDFAAPRQSAPVLPVVTDPGPHLCSPPVGSNPMGLEDPFWRELADSPLMRGWDKVLAGR